jgi:hypothetical protein
MHLGLISRFYLFRKTGFGKWRVATTPFSTPVQVLLNASKVLEEGKKKREVENELLSALAPLSCGRCNLTLLPR